MVAVVRFLNTNLSSYLLRCMSTAVLRLPGRIALLVLPLLFALGCTKNDSTVATPPTIPDRVLEDRQFSLLRAAIAYAGVGDALKDGNLTLFAPTDSAFQASGFGNVAAIIAMPKEQVRAMLMYHVLYGVVRSTDPNIRPNATVNVQTANGKLVNIIGPAIGLFDGIHISNATVTQPDQVVANGIIHTVDRVLLPPAGSPLVVLQSNPDLSLFVAALNRVSSSRPDLVKALNGGGTANSPRVVIFAPTNAAFQAAGYNDIAAINNANVQTLARLLAYHFLDGGVAYSWYIKAVSTGPGSTFKTLLGTDLTMFTTNNSFTVKGQKNQTAAVVKQADISATNGIIHIIDKVLQP